MDNKYEDLPMEAPHPTDPAYTLKLVKSTGAGAAFHCDGCKELGDGPRYTAGASGTTRTISLHTSCALADAATPLHHHLFESSVFRFLPTPPPPVDDRTICDACGEPARGFVYHCSDTNLDLHPCCASLPRTITLQGGYALELCPRASRGCAFCGGDKGKRLRKFWAYRWRDVNDGGGHVDLHVACVKEAARRAWDQAYSSRVGSGGGVVQASAPAMEAAVLQSLAAGNARSGSGLDKIVSTVVRVIITVVFGNPFAMIDALFGPGGFLRG